MFRSGIFPWLALGTFCVFSERELLACDTPASSQALIPLSDGILGAYGRTSYAWPRNAAFLMPQRFDDIQIGLEKESGYPIFARRMDTPAPQGKQLVRATSLLTENSTFTDPRRWLEYPIGDYVDETPPSIPQLLDAHYTATNQDPGCSKAACIGPPPLHLRLSVPIEDDTTPEDRVTVAIYLGSTAEDVIEKPEPTVFIPQHPQIGIYADPNWTDSIFIAVAALDAAGNASQKSFPIRVSLPSSAEGCMLRKSKIARLRGLSWFAVSGVLSFLGYLRRRSPLSSTTRLA